VRRERHAAFRFASVIVAPGEPHILNEVVETEVPLGGFRKRLDPMYEFHTRRRIGVHHILRRRDDERDYLRWCFADRVTAEAFAAEFSGTLVLPK